MKVKIALVPGGYGALGIAICRGLAEQGAKVIIGGCDEAGRIAEPRDVVGAVLFFCSPASDYITGQILYVDGGITASQ